MTFARSFSTLSKSLTVRSPFLIKWSKEFIWKTFLLWNKQKNQEDDLTWGNHFVWTLMPCIYYGRTVMAFVDHPLAQRACDERRECLFSLSWPKVNKGQYVKKLRLAIYQWFSKQLFNPSFHHPLHLDTSSHSNFSMKQVTAAPSCSGHKKQCFLRPLCDTVKD